MDNTADVLTCTVCMQSYNSSQRRPFDLGCGHSYCEACIKSSPRSFRNCPECRARASNPHANIALLRLLDALDGSTGPASTADNNSQQQSQQQQPRNQQPLSAFSPGGVFRSPGAGNEPLGSLGTMLNQVTAAIPGVTAAAAAGAGGGGGGINANSNAPAVVALPGSIAIHKANIAQLRTSMWVYLTPLLGALYILSPLDIIPDFIPLIGWLDDALVLYYVVCSLCALLKDRAVVGNGGSGGGSSSRGR